jgi:hypothetical protein
MQSLLRHLFNRATDKPTDGLTQPQREATLDLLLLAMYADNRIALSEDEAIEAQIAMLSWESGITPESYVNASTARVRAALDGEAMKADLLADISQRLVTSEARQVAWRLCDRLLKSDKDTTDAEAAFEAEIKRTFNL